MPILIPTEIVLHTLSKTLEVVFNNGERFQLPFEYLRVLSPSAEVQGHGKGQEKLVLGKSHVMIVRIEPVGNYAIKPFFDDGHASGIFSWQALYDLGKNKESNWLNYLERVSSR
jgi:DUF971 family protein